VIASDTSGRLTFLNPVAVTLTDGNLRRPWASRSRKSSESSTRRPIGRLKTWWCEFSAKTRVALANDTALVTKDGREVPIEDSAAPILDSGW